MDNQLGLSTGVKKDVRKTESADIFLVVKKITLLSVVLLLAQWISGVVVSALGMRTRRPRFESRVAPLFHWVATLGKLFTHIASPVSQLQETGVQKGVFGA